jgi:hypothetical protein
MKTKLFDLFEEVKLGEDYYIIKLNENLDEDIVLQEGIRYFKASQRLNKLVEQLKRRDTKELEPLIEIARRAAGEFARVEGKFESGEINKTQAKMRVNALKRYYSALLKIVKRNDFVKYIKIGGVSAILGGIIASMIFGFQPLSALGITLPKWDQAKNTFGVLGNDVSKQFMALKKAFQSKIIPFAKSIEGKL